MVTDHTTSHRDEPRLQDETSSTIFPHTAASSHLRVLDDDMPVTTKLAIQTGAVMKDTTDPAGAHGDGHMSCLEMFRSMIKADTQVKAVGQHFSQHQQSFAPIARVPMCSMWDGVCQVNNLEQAVADGRHEVEHMDHGQQGGGVQVPS